jgi:putative ABC transport system permease protein
MAYAFLPLEGLLRYLKTHPEMMPIAVGAAALAILVAGGLLYVYRKFFTFIFKSLLRNPLRTILSSAAIMVLVFVVTLITSILIFLDLVMTEKSQDLKAIVTERYQIPSQMPYSYAYSLERGAARSEHPEDVKPQDSMTWQFYGGWLDPTKKAREDFMFMFAMDPRKLIPMMEDMDGLDPALVEKMANNKKGVLMGKERLQVIKNHVGGRFTLTSANLPGINLEFEIVGVLPEGRNDAIAIMNRDYLNDAMDAYKRDHNGTPHPMAEKTLGLVWLRIPDRDAFHRVADQVMTSPDFSIPAVKCETASSGIASFLDSYRDLLAGMKWLLVPAILVTMSLVIANAISISVRERRTEMAVLKVLGFGPRRILAMVLGEAMLVGAISGFLSGFATYAFIHLYLHGIKFPIAFFPSFDIFADAMWWGIAFGALTSLVGSIVPAWSARSVKVADVFAKIG